MAAAFKNFLVNVIGFASDAQATRVRTTGLDSFATLSEYDKDDVVSLCRTLRKDSTNPMVIGPIVEKRLIQAASLSKHYDLMTRTLNATNLSKNRLSTYGKHMDMLEELKKKKNPELEKVGQKYSVTKFLEDFPLYLKTQIGVRGVPLSYVIREVDAPAPLEALETDKPYSSTNGS